MYGLRRRNESLNWRFESAIVRKDANISIKNQIKFELEKLKDIKVCHCKKYTDVFPLCNSDDMHQSGDRL